MAYDPIKQYLFRGRASTFRTPGRAGTTGQRLLSIYNSSALTLEVEKVTIDLAVTVIKAITVLPPAIRLYKVTVIPTNGNPLSKNKIGGSGASSGNIVLSQDASVDGTVSASALTATLPVGAIIAHEYAPRFITAAGYEMADKIEFLEHTSVLLLNGEGLVLALDYAAATQNPVTDMWICGVEWNES